MFFIVKWAALTLAFSAGIVATFMRVRDDSNRLTQVGRAGILLACLTFIATGFYDHQQKERDAREQASADSTAQAKADARTQEQERVLRHESLRLQELQHQALRQMDSAAVTARSLAILQQTALRDLGANLDLSRRMSDSVRTSMRMSRDLADSLRRIDTRATERAQQTLAVVERTTNPLTSLDAGFEIRFNRSDSLSATILEALYSRSKTAPGWLAAYDPADLPEHGLDTPVFMPENLILYLWHGDDCSTSFNYNDVFLSARRKLRYEDVDAVFGMDRTNQSVQYLLFRWPTASFEIQTNKNVSVVDLDHACMRVALNTPRMMGIGIAEQFWAESDVSVSHIRLPYGRYANIHPSDVIPRGAATRIVRLYVGS